MTQNTIVVFTSDNGGERFSNTWPFIGAKTELLEGGIRVPLIVCWPAQIPGGRTSAQMMMSMDFAPTLLAAAGAPNAMLEGFDGANLLNVLTGAASPHARTLFWRYKYAAQAAVRSGEWKYLKILDREWLFNLARDQHERADYAAHEPQIFDDLKAQFAAWNATMLPYPAESTAESVMPTFADRYQVGASAPAHP